MISTVVIIVKPDAYLRGLNDTIKRKVESYGLHCIASRCDVLPRKDVEEHYAEHYGKEFYSRLVKFMSEDIAGVYLYEGEDAVKNGRAALAVIRKELVVPGNKVKHENLIHVSDSLESAAREIQLWFPEY